MPNFGNEATNIAATKGIGSRYRNPFKAVLSENGILESVTVQIQSSAAGNFKVYLYDDSGNYPNVIIATSQPQSYPNTGGAGVQRTCLFTPNVNLSAGVYWFFPVGDSAFAPSCSLSSQAAGVGWNKYAGAVDYYNSPVDPFPGGDTPQTWNYCIFGTYSLPSNPWPTDMLKKGLISGYHCFMNQYIRATIEGLDPLKLPDGTVF